MRSGYRWLADELDQTKLAKDLADDAIVDWPPLGLPGRCARCHKPVELHLNPLQWRDPHGDTHTCAGIRTRVRRRA